MQNTIDRNKDNKDIEGMITSPINQGASENGIKINTTVTLSGDAVDPGDANVRTNPPTPKVNQESSIDTSNKTSVNASKVVPELPVTSGIVTAGKGSEMLNILVNDSFSTNKSGKLKKGGKNGKKNGKKAGKEKKSKGASIMGYSAMEIL